MRTISPDSKEDPFVQIIHAAVPGRARYKVAGLYRAASLGTWLEVRLAQIDGISYVSASSLTGNVLVCFEADTDPAVIAALIAKVLHEQQRSDPAQPPLSRPSHGTPKGLGQENGLGSRLQATGRTETSPSQSTGGKQVTQAADQKRESWHLMAANAVLASWKTSATTGLSTAAAHDRRQTYGPNVLPESEARSEWGIFLDQFASLPVGLLTVAAGMSLVTGGLADAVVILSVVAINATIGYLTESQSEKTIQSLKHLVTPSAVVVRDRGLTELPAAEVVPGDILVLKPGSYIAADSRLIEAQRLSVDESALTGESLPVSKTAAPLTSPAVPLADRVNMVYMGTLVTGGQGLAVVVATGRFTEIGQIQALANEAQAPETPLERQLDQMGTQLVYLSSGVCALVFGIGVLQGYGLLEMLKSAISLAVAAVPEGLPTVATTTLALGILNMRRHHVLVRRLDAVETLGCVQTICLDKTGTLTLNKMSVVAAYAGMRRFQIADGAFRVGTKQIAPQTCEELVKLAHVCVLCSETEIERQDTQYRLRGSSTENALLALGVDVDPVQLRADYPVVEVTLRAEDRNFMRTLHRTSQASAQRAPAPLCVAVKGSPLEVLAMCTWQMRQGELLPLTEEDRQRIEVENDRMAGEALRVIGVAYRDVDEIETEHDYYTGLTWLGLIGMTDPIRAGVKEVIGGFHRAGIDTVMITGDQSPTAYAIGTALALSRNGPLEILDSTHLAHLAPPVVEALVEKVQVFARVSPAHKLQIVQALQQAGKVVAMTGDGINDGPALKAADIGIAMGNTGTDVAREIADVVLEDDNLETMIVAIRQGRTIYTNIRKAVHFLLATNLSEIMVMFTAIAGGWGQPLSAMQLLWINLISDIFPGLALALEPPEPDVLSQPPRSPEDPILKTSDFRRLGFEAATLSAGALCAYGYGLRQYGMGPQASTLAFTTLASGQLLHALTSRSEQHSILGGAALPPNPYLKAALIGSFAVQGLSLIVPGLRSLLGITPLTLLDGLVIGVGAVLPFVVNEVTKNRTAPSDNWEDRERAPLALAFHAGPEPA